MRGDGRLAELAVTAYVESFLRGFFEGAGKQKIDYQNYTGNVRKQADQARLFKSIRAQHGKYD